jgi:hypothetical protein
MSLTVVVIARSETVRTRFAISSELMPLYDQMTPTTGMLMYGNISVGMVTTEIPPRMAISSAITMKVYGRRNASRTIHIVSANGAIAPPSRQ